MTGEDPKPASELIPYQTEDGRTRIECRFEGETLWLAQAQIAELFQKDVRTINEHLVNILDEGELSREATIRKLRMVRPTVTRPRRSSTRGPTRPSPSWACGARAPAASCARKTPRSRRTT
jgi:hypothetical protein